MMEMEGVRGIKGIRELNYRLIFIATNVIVENNQFREEEENDLPEDGFNENMEEKEQFNEEEIISKVFSKLSEQEIKMMMEFK